MPGSDRKSLITVTGPGRRPILGAILVGGASDRLGRDKALVEVGGISLVERVRRSLSSVADRILVVGKRGERHPLPDLEFVPEPHPVRCSLAGLAAAVSAAGDERIIIVGCDHPFLSPDLLRALAAPGAAVVRVAEREGRLEPLLACWDAGRALTVLRRRLDSGQLSLFGAIEELGADILTEEEARRIDPELRSFMNVNTPEDLANAVLTLEKY